MKIETLLSCPDCGKQCTGYVKQRSRTFRIECPECGISDYVPDYAERIEVGG